MGRGSGFNRTFMELKQSTEDDRNCILDRFNRTFMELKRRNMISNSTGTLGLIVPLWN